MRTLKSTAGDGISGAVADACMKIAEKRQRDIIRSLRGAMEGKDYADPETCPHPKQTYRGIWRCDRCGEEL